MQKITYFFFKFLFVVCDLSEEEKKQIMLREDFHQFFDRASRVIERALCEDIDILVDYTGNGEEQDA